MTNDPHTVRAFFMCTSACFIATYFLPYLIGLTAGGSFQLDFIVIGLLFCVSLSTVIEALNRLSDRAEDTINRPGRTHLCEMVGFDFLSKIAKFSLLVALAAGVTLAYRADAVLAWIMVGVSVFVAVGYSYMPGGAKPLKQSRLLSPTLNTLPYLAPFFGAVSLTSDLSTDLAWSAFGIAVLIYTAILGIGGAKDVTDVLGDLSIGYRSAYLDHLNRPSAVHIAYPILYSIAVLAFVLTDAIPVRSFAIVPAVSIAYWYVLSLSREGVVAPSTNDAMRARLVSSNLQMALVALIGIVVFPQVKLIVGVVATMTYWALARRWLYWARYEMQTGPLADASGTTSADRLSPD